MSQTVLDFICSKSKSCQFRFDCEEYHKPFLASYDLKVRHVSLDFHCEDCCKPFLASYGLKVHHVSLDLNVKNV